MNVVDVMNAVNAMNVADNGQAEAAGAVLRDRFRDGMSRGAASVSVVTTDGQAGRAGVTVSSMTPVTVDGPAPQLLICAHREASASRVIVANGVFVVNVLRANQAAISDVFAGRTALVGAARFAAAEWTLMASGAPRLIDPLASFDCRLTDAKPVGTHLVMFGAVTDVFVAEAGAPLIYADRGYRTAGGLREAA